MKNSPPLPRGGKKLTPSERERLERVFKNHPVLSVVHAEMHEFLRLLNEKHPTADRAKPRIPKLLSHIKKYRAGPHAPMQTSAKTLHPELRSWR